MFEFRQKSNFWFILYHYRHLIRTYKITISIRHVVLYNTNGQQTMNKKLISRWDSECELSCARKRVMCWLECRFAKFSEI